MGFFGIRALPGMRLPFRGRAAPRPARGAALYEFSRTLALVVDERELHEVTAAKLQEVFALDRVALFIRAGDGAPYRIASSRGCGEGDAAAAEFPADGRLAGWLRLNETPLFLAEEPGVRSHLGDGERRMLEELGAVACFPMTAMNRLTGFVALRPAAGAATLDAESRETLAALLAQVALALENAALLREQKARLKRLYRAERLATAGELAAGAAHEIRNPLTAIRSTIQYLRGDYPATSERASLMEAVIAEVDRIDTIVQGLLSFARHRSPAFEPVDLGELVRQGVALVGARARNQGVALSVHAAEEIRIEADADLLKQVLLNVLLNALQAMPRGGTIEVAVQPRGGTVLLRVSDTGHGIAPEHLDRVFDPFFSTKQEGTGLGLSICYGIVERHGGEMTVESEPGRGTTFTVRLPLRQPR